jgi:transmembrane sensor
MSKHNFKNLLQKYLRGECTPHEIELIEQWYSVLGDDIELSLSENERQTIEERLWHHVKPTNKSNRAWIRWAAAASVLVMLGTGLFWYNHQSNNSSIELGQSIQSVSGEKLTNSSASSKRFNLPDGSTVVLSAGASIEYAKAYNQTKREVFLKGEAFFEVMKNADKPFFVYAGKVATKVLGTSFKVNAPTDGSTIEVRVRTGKVSVYEIEKATVQTNELHKEVSGVILTPNQKVTFFAKQGHWVTGLVENPISVFDTPEKPEIKQPSFSFDETPIIEVFAQLEQAYGIGFVFEDSQLKSTTFTGDINDQSLYTQLELVCRSINARYEIQGTKILIRKIN